MRLFSTIASTDARVNRKVDRAFRGALAFVVTVLLLAFGQGRADAAEHRPSADRSVEVRATSAALV